MLILNTGYTPMMVKLNENGITDSVHVMARGRVTVRPGVKVDHNYLVMNPTIKVYNDDGTAIVESQSIVSSQSTESQAQKTGGA